MVSPQKFSNLFLDLQQLERIRSKPELALTEQGEVILGAFLRNTPFDSGAVYLRTSRDAGLRLAAKSSLFVAPDCLEAELPKEVIERTLDAERFARMPIVRSFGEVPRILVPLRHTREEHGVVALSSTELVDIPSEELGLLRAVSTYVGALLTSQRLTDEAKEGDFQLKYRLWELESLYDIGLSIASTLNGDELGDEILVRTVSLLNARRAALYLRQGDRFVLRKAFGEVRSQFLDDELGREVADRIIRDLEPVIFDSGADCIFPSCESLIALPIRGGNEIIGILAAADRERREGGVGPFLPSEVRLLSQFATQAGIALENARLHREALDKQAMERELELAATIQREILPRSIPQIEGFQIAAFSRPARQLGGDYHAFYEHEDGKLTVCLGDVAGKSVPAAVLVSALHAALQLLIDEGRELGDIATELNKHIHRWSSENKFITLIIATIDRDAGIIRYVNAGHNPGYIVTPDTVDLLHSHGLPIGILPGSRYVTQTRRFARGTMLVIYSDGFTEAENPAGEEFGNEGLASVLEQNADKTADAVRDAITRAADAFVAGAPQSDDQTLVLVRTT